MIYNEDYEKLKNLGTDNYCNAPLAKDGDIAPIGTDNFCNQNDIWNLEEVLCLWTKTINKIIKKINELVNKMNQIDADTESLKQQVQNLINQVKILIEYIKTMDLTNYYTKSEIDEMIKNLNKLIANIDLSNYYTKSEIDALLEGLVPVDLSNYFTKPEIRAIYSDIENINLSKVYTNVDIISNTTYRKGDTIYYNLKVKKNDSSRFEKFKKYDICYTPIKIKPAVYSITATGKGVAVSDYVVPAVAVLQDTGKIHIATSEACSELIITGSCQLAGNYSDNLLFNTIPVLNIPEPIPEPAFRELFPREIYNKLKAEFGYTDSPEESTSAYTVVYSTDRKLKVNFWHISDDLWDKYEIINVVRDTTQMDKIKFILGFTFTYGEIERIVTEIDREDPNQKVLRIRERDVALESDSKISVQY